MADTILRMKTTCRCMHPSATCSNRSLRSCKLLHRTTNSHPPNGSAVPVLHCTPGRQGRSCPPAPHSTPVSHWHIATCAALIPQQTTNRCNRATAIHSSCALVLLAIGSIAGLDPCCGPSALRTAVPPSTLVNVHLCPAVHAAQVIPSQPNPAPCTYPVAPHICDFLQPVGGLHTPHATPPLPSTQCPSTRLHVMLLPCRPASPAHSNGRHPAAPPQLQRTHPPVPPALPTPCLNLVRTALNCYRGP